MGNKKETGKKKFRVFAEMTAISYLDVEAETEEEAREIAEETDGGAFTPTEDGDWEITGCREMEETA